MLYYREMHAASNNIKISLGAKKFRVSGCSRPKVREEWRRKIFIYYLFLYHDVSCNITQQLLKNKLTH